MAQLPRSFVLQVREYYIAFPYDVLFTMSPTMKSLYDDCIAQRTDWPDFVALPDWIRIPGWAFSHVADWMILVDRRSDAIESEDERYHYFTALIVARILSVTWHESDIPSGNEVLFSLALCEEHVAQLDLVAQAADFMGVDQLSNSLTEATDEIMEASMLGFIPVWEDLMARKKEETLLLRETPLLSLRRESWQRQVLLVATKNRFFLRYPEK